jgi:hypothetical protein
MPHRSWSGCAAGRLPPSSPGATTPVTADEHIGRYRLLAERCVSTVFVSLPDLAGPQDVFRLVPVAASFA